MPRVEMAIGSNAYATRRKIGGYFTRRWKEVVLCIFRIDSAFNGMALNSYVRVTVSQLFTRRHANLLPYQIHSCRHLSDCMFNLETRIHLEEIEIIVLIKDKFDCAYVWNT